MMKLLNKLLCICMSSFVLMSTFKNSDIILALNENDSISKEKYYIGQTIRAGKDDGFAKKDIIDKDDKHYGWDLGKFEISGFTRKDTTDSSEPIFLKNVGDEVQLSFNLEQDIEKLNDNEKLSISDDKKSYDEYFGIEETSFHRGALIIRYTDYQNNKGEPQIYTDYLVGIKKDADTVVKLCEEGDYEVALDYTIASETFGDIGAIKTSNVAKWEYDYRIFFKFKVRNGNCMVYPFDSKTGQELTNTAFTPNGFKLDLAKSRYLNIDITKQIMNPGKDGLTEDTRFNKPAKDGEMFTDEGVYTITVSNKYTDRTTEKIIYVGENSVLQAYVTNSGYSVSQINNMVDNGAVIKPDGTIEMPVTTIATTEATTKATTKITSEDTNKETTAITDSDNKKSIDEENLKKNLKKGIKEVSEELNKTEDPKSDFPIIIVVCIIAVIAVGVIVVFVVKKKGK